MSVTQGDLYWLVFPEDGPTPIKHPCVVIQDDLINHSRVTSTVVCGLSTNMKKAYEPGNILLPAGEGDLPKQSVIVVSQISAVEKARLTEYIGRLSPDRIAQIFDGMKLLQGLSAKSGG